MRPSKDLHLLTRNQMIDRVIKQLKKSIREVEQIIRDGNYFNGLRKGEPVDLEQYRVDLHKLKKCLAKFLVDNKKDPE